ncbi:MAG: DUF2254 domain-containing protein [Proteobacteria bacterium]|jgi:hypothetical protein|nr:DUF2254 domain-containing protein [Pseudomonadota bacterium]
MHEAQRRKYGSYGWAVVLLATAAVSIGGYGIVYALDNPGGTVGGFFDLAFRSAGASAFSNMPEVIAGVLGIAITVVAIIVELASNRYTSRITELFIASHVNQGVLGFFVVTCLLCVWTALTGRSADADPHYGSLVATITITTCLLMLLPYFAFVFAFLNPHNIIDRMAGAALAAIRRAGRGGIACPRQRQLAVRSVEQLADVALNAFESKDKVICMHAVDSLGGLMRDYLSVKRAFGGAFFSLDAMIRENPDFVSMQDDVFAGIESGRFWFEMKILRQYQMLYGETLNRARDINYLIAINTRKTAEEAMALDEAEVVALAVKFFNTYMRATINGQDVRTAYNVLNQYRLLAEAALRNGREEIALEIARRFQYYGQLGFGAGLRFVLETAAYDLCRLNELAFELASPRRRELLGIFLEVDKEAEEGHDLEASLRGVRKAQVKLATFYLMRGDEAAARVIFDDMRAELPSRLASIRGELAGITERDFWEISDRGVNFDYLEPGRRAALDVFFEWFRAPEGAAQPASRDGAG